MPDLTKGHTFATGDVVTAANLNTLLDDATINNDAVTADMMAANSVKNISVSSSAAIELSKLEKPTDGRIIVGRASDGAATAVPLSGDATIIADGTLTLEDDAVTTDKIIDNAVDGAKIAMGSDAAGDILYYNGTDYIRLAKGTATNVLTQEASAPAWVAPAVVALNYAQVEITGVKNIHNHTSGDQDEANGGTKGEEDSFYLYTDGTASLDTTLTRRALDSKVKIEFVLNADTNSGRGWWGKVQSSLDDGGSWQDTLVGDVGPGGGSDLRRSVQFSALHRYHTNALGQISFSYIHDPGGGAGEEAVRYRVIVGVHASHHITVNYSQDEGMTTPRPTGNGGVQDIRAVSHMTLTEIPV